ncbi:MAG: DUF4252 domain-containing protein [Flavobacterium sp.]
MKKISVFIVLVVFMSCNNKPSLQKFMVENTDKKDFIALDFSSDVLNIPKNKLTKDENEALKSLKKINVLGFKKNQTNDKEYEINKNKLFEMMKDTTTYQEIMKVGNLKQSAAIYVLENKKGIEEIVIIGNRIDVGFGIIRILGENMKEDHAITMVGLMNKVTINPEQLKPFKEFLK